MNIETAFLFGVLVGQWVLLWAIWRATIKLVKIVSSREVNTDSRPDPGSQIIYIPPDEDSELD